MRVTPSFEKQVASEKTARPPRPVSIPVNAGAVLRLGFGRPDTPVVMHIDGDATGHMIALTPNTGRTGPDGRVELSIITGGRAGRFTVSVECGGSTMSYDVTVN